MSKKKTFLKGKLTKLSAAGLSILQTPNLISDVSQTAQVFAEKAEVPITWLSLVAAAGIIWGGIRKAFSYFGDDKDEVVESTETEDSTKKEDSKKTDS